MPSSRPMRLLFIAAACLASALPASADVEILQKSFITPPDDARMMVRWWWFGPAVTREGIDRELKAMKDGGYGGVEVQPTYPLALDGADLKNLKFMSPEFLEMIGYAAAKAKELGLRYDLTLGSGWPYGGPQFSINEAAGRLETQVLPAPAGQGSIPLPQFQAGRSLIAAFAGPAGIVGSGRGRGAGGGAAGGADARALKEVPITNGALQLPANFPGGEVVLFIAGRTGMQVKRPALGAEGFVIDHLSAKVVDKFIAEIAEPELKACGDNPPYSFFCDSLEINGENWTDDFLAEFQKRRGYDLKPLLPALIGNVGERTADIRHDFGRTVTDLFNENFNAKFKALAKKYNTRYRIQGYGYPPAGLFSYAFSDLPEGEGGGNVNWRSFRATRYAASASHLMGVKTTSSEAFTWLHSAPFRATPLDMKGAADAEFLDGITQLICHGWPYTAAGAAYPGWSFYAAAVVNDKNPWYIAMPEINAYMARTSHLLREGIPANDIALYMSNSDVWSRATTGFSSLNATWQGLSGVATQLLDAGYNFDGWDDGMLELKGRVDGGALAFGDVKYKVVLLPGIETMPLETARKLEQFVKGGGHIAALGTLPSRVPGYHATPAHQQELQAIMGRLFREPGAPGVAITGEGTFAEAFATRLPPDLRLDPPVTGIGHVHRRTDAGELYFLANTTPQRQNLKATFRVADRSPELWDALTGKIRPLSMADKSDVSTTVALELEPYGSTFVLFGNRTLPAPPAPPPPPAAASLPPIDITADWTVKVGDKTFPMRTLQSWTQLEGLQNYSGVATYEKTITLTPEQAQAPLALAFANAATPAAQPPAARVGRGGGGGRFAAQHDAPVKDAAVVFINGQRAGAAWCLPYRVDLTGLLKPGQNTLRIEVGNTPINHIAGAGFPNYNIQAIRAQFGNRFDPQGTEQYAQPLPSGLLGTIRLESAR